MIFIIISVLLAILIFIIIYSSLKTTENVDVVIDDVEILRKHVFDITIYQPEELTKVFSFGSPTKPSTIYSENAITSKLIKSSNDYDCICKSKSANINGILVYKYTANDNFIFDSYYSCENYRCSSLNRLSAYIIPKQVYFRLSIWFKEKISKLEDHIQIIPVLIFDKPLENKYYLAGDYFIPNKSSIVSNGTYNLFNNQSIELSLCPNLYLRATSSFTINAQANISFILVKFDTSMKIINLNNQFVKSATVNKEDLFWISFRRDDQQPISNFYHEVLQQITFT